MPGSIRHGSFHIKYVKLSQTPCRLHGKSVASTTWGVYRLLPQPEFTNRKVKNSSEQTPRSVEPHRVIGSRIHSIPSTTFSIKKFQRDPSLKKKKSEKKENGKRIKKLLINAKSTKSNFFLLLLSFFSLFPPSQERFLNDPYRTKKLSE